MWPRMVLALALAGALGAIHPSASRAQDGRWLDGPLPHWNAAGRPVPPAPPTTGFDPRCREQVRPAETAADHQLLERGWLLFGAYQGGWGIAVIRAGASVDGMCRPLQYNVFVFRHGQLVGTVAPTLMDSRTDGQEAGVTLLGPLEPQGPVRLTARFLRYAPNDPLCCPSLPAVVVTYEVQQADGGDVLVPRSKEPG